MTETLIANATHKRTRRRDIRNNLAITAVVKKVESVGVGRCWRSCRFKGESVSLGIWGIGRRVRGGGESLVVCIIRVI